MSAGVMRYKRKWDGFDVLVAFVVVLIVAAVVGVAFLAVDYITADSRVTIATVTGRSYTPSSTSVGSGVAVGGNGRVTSVVTTSTNPEVWILIMESDGYRYPAKTNASRWASLKDGEQCEVVRQIGGVSGATLSIRVP